MGDFKKSLVTPQILHTTSVHAYKQEEEGEEDDDDDDDLPSPYDDH